MALSRRELMKGAALAAGAATLNSEQMQAQAGAPPTAPRKIKFVVTGGHPGDPEYGCGGTVSQLTRRGHSVTLLYLNDGAWPPTAASVRLQEARKACDLLNATPAWAGQTNGAAVVDNSRFDNFCKLLEAESPDAVFTHWPLDNHRDHRACWDLTFDAWLKMGRRFPLYYYEVSDGRDTFQFAPTHFVDITASETVKRTACYAHASQSPDSFYTLQDQVAVFRGIESGVKRAEGFVLQWRGGGDVLSAALGTALV